MDSERIGAQLTDGSEREVVQLPLTDDDVVVQLHAACLLAAEHDPIDPRIPYSSAEYEIIQSAGARFVASCVTNDLPPERILTLLKRAVNEGLRAVGREPQEIALRSIILEAFLHSYYGDGQPRERSARQ